jgi:hypothetical protein
MILRDRVLLALTAMLLAPCAMAGEAASTVATAAPLAIPHTLNLELDYYAKRRARSTARNYESSDFLDLTPGLQPLAWPRNSDIRARMLTPELRRTPLVGWIARNLYRSRHESGWCLEVDPGEGEYIVFYRVHLD